MEPLRVTAKLLTGQLASLDRLFALDSILAWAWMMENHPERMMVPPGADLIDPVLPLEKRIPEHDPLAWYWVCSFAQFQADKEYVRHYHKRFDLEREANLDLRGRSGKLNPALGPTKNYRKPQVILSVPELVWYCKGDKEKIRRLLDSILSMGQNKSHGWGMIREWIVEPWPKDWSEKGPEGKLTRPIPVPADEAESWQGIRPPYWHVSTRFPVRCMC